MAHIKPYFPTIGPENNKKEESKTTIKNGASKRTGRGWGERKETRADKAVDFENHPLACHA